MKKEQENRLRNWQGFCRRHLQIGKMRDAGKILYEVNDLWTSEVVVEPKDRNSVRLRCPKDFMADARVLKKNQEYTIQNMTTGTKTKIKIS